MREAVRSGRRANFFITENRFIDCYARKVGGNGVAVYSILQRCANSATRETWIGADKMAEVLDMDRSTVYRYLKQLEDLRLIKTLRTREKTIYVVLPVPPPPSEAGPTPLFDAIEVETRGETEVEIRAQNSSLGPVAPLQMNLTSATDFRVRDSSVAVLQHPVSSARPTSRTGANRNKEEQDPLNKTQEQEFKNKSLEWGAPEIHEAAQRILNILKLSDSSLNAAMAAVELKARGTKLSPDDIVTDIWNKARQAERRSGSCESYLKDCLAETLAERILDEINLPPTSNVIAIVAAAIKAEAKDRKLDLEETAALITTSAIEDRRRGTEINRFYFENCKWRSNAKVNKAEQRKLDNLEVNARVKQRLRERLQGI
jgi:urease gamma subunit